MEIVCQNCMSKFKLPDEKIPADKVTALPCPKCKSKISIGPRNQMATSVQADINSSDYDASEKPFDFIEEEGSTALVCESDTELLKTIVNNLNLLEYHVTVSDSGRDALKKMRYHQYDLILVNESFDTMDSDKSGVLGYLERLPMQTRRNIFIILISQRYRTLDDMMAFNKSVNMIINTKNIGEAEKILSRGVTDSDLFYRVFNDSLKKVGEI